jgi:transcriptional regulator with XRE-family HTH domain
MRDRRWSVVRFEGVPYEMNRHAVRVALVQRQVEGKFHTREELAQAIGCSRSTVSRFLSGRGVGVAITLKALSELDLTFDQVFTRREEEEEEQEP